MKPENKEQLLENIFHSFERYYSIKKEEVTPPFAAEADFISHNEQYFLVKSAKIADIDSNEYVFFAITDNLTMEQFLNYDKTAWETGMSRVHPYNGHRNTDVTLVIIADTFDEDVKKIIRKTRHSKSYKFGFWGWSNYKLCTLEFFSNKFYANRLGKDLKKIFKY